MSENGKLKVVILSTAVSYTGGAIISLLNVIPLLQEKGVQPCFILKGHGPLEKELEEMQIPYYIIKSYDWCIPAVKKYGLKNRATWIVKSIINLIAEIQTVKVLKKEDADVFHLNCMYNGTGVNAARYLGISIVWHLREFIDMPENTMVLVNSKKAWKKINFSDKIICVSKYLKKCYKPYIADQSKIHVVYDGINMEKFIAKNISFKFTEMENKCSSSNVIIGMSGTAPIKGHDDAIRAVGLLKQKGIQNITLRVAGRWLKDKYNNSYYQSLQKLIEQYNLKDNVEFLGAIDDMNTFWRQLDIALVCSKYESFGLSAVEAMVCSVPLICSKTSISRELTDNGKNVSTYQTGDYSQLSEVIEECLGRLGTEEMKRRLINAKKFVRNEFSMEKSAEAFYAALNKGV